MEWWDIPRKAWAIILVELSGIIGLSGWVVSEYFNNVYFRGYVNSISPILVPVLSVAFGVASATTAIFLYFGTRSLQNDRKAETIEPQRRRTQTRRLSPKTMSEQKSVKNPHESSGATLKPKPAQLGKTPTTHPKSPGSTQEKPGAE